MISFVGVGEQEGKCKGGERLIIEFIRDYTSIWATAHLPLP